MLRNPDVNSLLVSSRTLPHQQKPIIAHRDRCHHTCCVEVIIISATDSCAGLKSAYIKEESLENNSHNGQKVRLCLSHGQEIYDQLLGWQPNLLVWAAGVSSQLAYSRTDPTLQSAVLLYISTCLSYILLAYFDKAVRDAKADEPAKPIVCSLHVHSWLEELPKFVATTGISILGIIEEDFESANKAAKAAGSRSKRYNTEFQVRGMPT